MLAPASYAAGSPVRRCVITQATENDMSAAPSSQQQQPAVTVADKQQEQQQQPSSSSPSSSVTSSMEGTTKRKARVGGDSTDPVASFLSRRFG
jgi:hypothetical protein